MIQKFAVLRMAVQEETFCEAYLGGCRRSLKLELAEEIEIVIFGLLFLLLNISLMTLQIRKHKTFTINKSHNNTKEKK